MRKNWRRKELASTMIKRLSEALGVSAEDLAKQGVLDTFLDVDSQFHIDPVLVKSSAAPELAGAYSRLTEYFKSILLLASKTQGGDVLERGAVAMLTFKEIDLAGLGFARESKRGRAFSPKLARQVFETARAIIRAGIEDPAIFELIGVFEEKIGADLISDMVLHVIIDDMVEFNRRVAENLKLKTCDVRFAGKRRTVPCTPDKNEPVLLLPSDILCPLPVATCWDDIDTVATYNEELRDRVNKLVGATWRDATRKIHKRDLKAMLLKDPELLKDLLTRYKGKPGIKYDFERDPLGEFIWADAAKDATSKNPLALQKPTSHDQVVEVVRQICRRFKQFIEHNALNLLLYDDQGNPRPERFSQLLFFGVADCYCDANNLDLSREPNAGRGPVDFKVSAGYHSRVTVEIKLTTNKKLLSGFSNQLPAYNAAEKTFHSVLLVVDVGGSPRKLKLLDKVKADAIATGQRVPEIFVVDGHIKPSASRL